MQNDEFTIFLILFVILYADDTIIVSDNAKEFQDTFNEYCKQWKLKINISKTKIIIFGDYIKLHTNFSFHFDFKYLGVLFYKEWKICTAY